MKPDTEVTLFYSLKLLVFSKMYINCLNVLSKPCVRKGEKLQESIITDLDE